MIMKIYKMKGFRKWVMRMKEDKTHYYKPSVTKGEYVSEKELIENLVYPDTMYKKQIQELEQELQSYKSKEDKLREYIDGDEVRVYNDKRLSDGYKDGYARCCVDILQILNDKVVE